MERIYDYQKNITINKTYRGERIITMNEEILTLITNCIHDASEYQKKQGYNATSADTKELWEALIEKQENL